MRMLRKVGGCTMKIEVDVDQLRESPVSYTHLTLPTT